MEVPEKFDWVTARSECNGEVMFSFLQETIEGDVESINKTLDDERHFYKCNHDFNKITVAVGRRRTVFKLENSCISVNSFDAAGNKEDLFKAKPHLLRDGSCKFEIISGQPLELWQISRIALERMFFE